jgi:hypothetical protein
VTHVDGEILADLDRIYWAALNTPVQGILRGWFFEPGPPGSDRRSRPIGPFKTRAEAMRARTEYNED